MIFHQLFDAASSAHTYRLSYCDTRKTLLIDPVYEQHARDFALIGNLCLKVDHGEVLAFGDCWLTLRTTPGHTDGCLTRTG